jgi:hypothetical protein
LLAAALLTGLAAGLLVPAFAAAPAGSAEATPAKAQPQNARPAAPAPPQNAKAAAPAPPAVEPSWKAAYAGARSQRGELYYARLYGVDQMQVRSVASGSSLEFRYRVLDAQRAALLTDKHAKPVLIDQKTGNRLTVPTMEKIGELRQTVTPEQGREYWMVFANPGKLVKPGQRVDVVVGAFHVSGLTVE